MKKGKGLMSILLAVAMLGSAFLSGCNVFGEEGDDKDVVDVPTDTEYTIQYTDDAGSHMITVKYGDTYALESVPTREGYVFSGLFDAKKGGVRYVDETGQSLSPFTDRQNMVLFPQFEPKQYTVVLDYGGAPVTGSRQFNINYGESLPELPKNLELENSTFEGWFTQPNGQGIQVADEYGVIPIVSVVNSENFDLSSEYIRLYAGFSMQQFTVTFNFGNGIQSQEMKVDYNTPVSEIDPGVRNSKGQAVLSWSKTSGGGQIFNGNITDDTVLYAVEWAPVIELDTNGGEKIAPVVAREGTSVTLPIPERKNYKFMGWQTKDGSFAEISMMPAENASLIASWQAMLVFDENGGTDVKDISQATGTGVSLPIPEKEGFVFAGWYTADAEKYTAAAMPAASVELRAGWYARKRKEKIFLTEDSYSSVIYDNSPMFFETYRINLAEDISDFDWTVGGTVSFSFHADIRHDYDQDGYESTARSLLYASNEHFFYYSQDKVSDIYFLGSTTLNHGNNQINTTFTEMNWTTTLSVPSSGIIYIGLASDKKIYHSSWGSYYKVGWRMTNFYVTIHYPDTSNLYL